MQNRMLPSNKRAVSPIIATILLVAITVVLAAVLYILVTGLIGGSHTVTSTIGVSETGVTTCASTTPVATDNAYVLTVASTSATVTTANVGITITQSGQASPTPPVTMAAGNSATAGDSCPAVSAAQGCVSIAANTWLAVLSNTAGTVQAYYGTGGTSGWYSTAAGCVTALGSPVTLSSGMTVTILTGSSFSGSALSFFGQGGASVTGGTTL